MVGGVYVFFVLLVFFLCWCVFVMDSVNGLRGKSDWSVYEDFVRLYNAGVPVGVICGRLGVGSTRYFRLFHRALDEGRVRPRNRRRG